MREWSNQWNPFNSAKVLLWKDHLEACARGDYLVPVTVDIDPTNKCNYDCIWCNAYDMIHGNKQNELSESHLIKLANFLKEWGSDKKEGHPRSACIAGGGEPLLNPATMALLEQMNRNGLENGLITNGSLLSREYIDIISKTCRWVGISMDAATSETYCKVKGITNEGLFGKVVENVRALIKETEKNNPKCRIAYKYLVHPDNAHEIYDAIKLARDMGIHDFHLRPVGWENLTITKDKEKIDFSSVLQSIDLQIEEGLKLETERFKVYGIRHKFNPNMTVKKNFSKCWAIPILPTFGADGNVHTCFDMRGRKDLIMCSHDPDVENIAKFWNSPEHHEMVNKIKIEECPRCTFTAYNEIIEKVIIDDTMCRNFP